ncbi:MAG: hypothetical protein RLZZ387_5064 [Chloroflexota bacterium]|jgi:hypothetical protein
MSIDDLDAQQRGRLMVLAEEYLDLVRRMQAGAYTDEQEWRILSAERGHVHDELLLITGRSRANTDMVQYCYALRAGQAVPPPTEHGKGHVAHHHGRG